MVAALIARAIDVAVENALKKQSPPRDLAVVIGTGSNHEGA